MERGGLEYARRVAVEEEDDAVFGKGLHILFSEHGSAARGDDSSAEVGHCLAGRAFYVAEITLSALGKDVGNGAAVAKCVRRPAPATNPSNQCNLTEW